MAQNKEVKVVLVDDLSSEHFDTSNSDHSNKIKVKMPEGIITDLTFDGKKLKYNKSGERGQQELDLSSLNADIYATSATYDPSNTTLSIQRNGEQDAITVNLGELAKSTVGNDTTSAVTLSGNGKQGDPLKADVKLGDTKNLLNKSDNGELSVDEDDVKRIASEVATEKVGGLGTITLKNAFGDTELGVVYAKPSEDE